MATKTDPKKSGTSTGVDGKKRDSGAAPQPPKANTPTTTKGDTSDSARNNGTINPRPS